MIKGIKGHDVSKFFVSGANKLSFKNPFTPQHANKFYQNWCQIVEVKSFRQIRDNGYQKIDTPITDEKNSVTDFFQLKNFYKKTIKKTKIIRRLQLFSILLMFKMKKTI